jgi:hypothetical protein
MMFARSVLGHGDCLLGQLDPSGYQSGVGALSLVGELGGGAV